MCGASRFDKKGTRETTSADNGNTASGTNTLAANGRKCSPNQAGKGEDGNIIDGEENEKHVGGAKRGGIYR